MLERYVPDRVVSLTNENGPDVNENEKQNVRKLLQREEKRKDVVWHTLCVSIERMESMARIRGRHNPFMMGFV